MRLASGLAAELSSPDLVVAHVRALASLSAHREVDVLVIDLPDIVGRTAAARRTTGSRLLVLGGTPVEASACLELGASAWLPKHSPAALVASQVRALNRRDAAPERARVVEVGSLQVDPVARRASVNGREVNLTPREFALLAVLANNAGRVLSRDRILAQAWGPRFVGEPKTVDVHVAWLRQKLEGAGLRLTALRGIGYRLDVLEPGRLVDESVREAELAAPV